MKKIIVAALCALSLLAANATILNDKNTPVISYGFGFVVR